MNQTIHVSDCREILNLTKLRMESDVIFGKTKVRKDLNTLFS